MSQGRRGGGGRGDRGQSRGDRGGFAPRGDRGRGSAGGDRGGRGAGRGDRGARGDRGGGFPPRGERGGGFRGRGGPGAGEPLAAYGSSGIAPDPDQTVQQNEDVITRSFSRPPERSLSDAAALSLRPRHPSRPAYGVIGNPTRVWVNHFRLNPSSDLTLYRYHIQVNPEARGRKLKRIVQLLLTEGRVSRLGLGLASDFSTTLIASEELTEEDLEERIPYRFEEEDIASDRATNYSIVLQPTGVLDIGAFMRYVRSEDGYATFEQQAEYIQALNIVIDHHAKSQAESDTMSLGPNKHYDLQGQAAQHADIGAGLVAWRGYLTTVRSSATRLVLNIQIKHAAAYSAVPLGMLIARFRQDQGDSVRRLETFLKGVRIRLTHLNERTNRQGKAIPRIKTIVGIASASRDGKGQAHPPRVQADAAGPTGVQFFLARAEGTPSSSRGSRGGGRGGTRGGTRGGPSSAAVAGPQAGEYVTVANYFRRTYDLQVNAYDPVVNVGSRQDPVYLPADVCFVLPGQTTGRKLSANQTRSMLQFAVRRPNLNADSIANSGSQVVGTNPQNPTLARFGISLNANLLTVPARVLSGPNIKYRDNQTATPRFGSWNMDKIKFVAGTEAVNWSFVVVNSRGRREENGVSQAVKAFSQELARSGVANGVPLGEPGFWMNLSEETVDQFFRRASQVERRPRILLMVLDTDDSKVYNSIKRAGDVMYGVHTICVLKKNLLKRKGDNYDIQYFANVALKFNMKLGGTNQTLDQNKFGIIAGGKTMLVGIDVTHPSPHSSKNAVSVAGMVASINRACSQFPAVLRLQSGGQEIVSAIRDMLQTRLNLWKKHNNNNLPENILVYRDGVSEGQFDVVLEQELLPMKEACRLLYSTEQQEKGLPKITVVICGKRHNTRFYPTSTESGRIDIRSANNPNGTIVDRGVSDPRYWDFFLQAHTAIQGTARPAHYYVVHDEIFADRKLSDNETKQGLRSQADALQDLTHNLSYMFGRATKAISVCPPAYYADLLCERARAYLSEYFDPDSEAEPGSAATSTSGESAAPTQNRVEIHEAIRDSMFYI